MTFIIVKSVMRRTSVISKIDKINLKSYQTVSWIYLSSYRMNHKARVIITRGLPDPDFLLNSFIIIFIEKY
jgi:hypothetical protein